MIWTMCAIADGKPWFSFPILVSSNQYQVWQNKLINFDFFLKIYLAQPLPTGMDFLKH